MTGAAAPVVISCGEPAGIGPEIAARAWAALKGKVPLAWMGDPRHLPTSTPFEVITTPAAAADVGQGALPVLHHAFPNPTTPGSPDPANAQGVIDVIAACVDLVKSGAASALCTAPIHKKALIDGADFAYPGHTEYLAALAGGARAVMMLASDALRVVPATIHIALEDVPTTLTPALLRETIEITETALRDRFGIAAPRIAVAGLNPHAGEGGAMGRQELDWIEALIADMARAGRDLRGPLPADTMFHAAARRSYDAAIAMYHDQALIPIKTLDFDKGVNVTLGLPFVRTSPDHGTAFDIAGAGVANPTSMIEAIKMAAKMTRPG
ncbi:4-hydroxythreonine-4-phosphate dehydrogenase PdxA [uncultured Roseobacter sp.]|uniref:4-hydroxythreonine-4-phosphate dehydrogenase PdxA n=1 Tax=uncultured Roseobacter sp. TaxID=114847 RepID=UPI002604E911|nr:4-hydroxythreonine-4-phosphate dehydrogenase PdxA [uncultured Roseobacter sp.]